MLWQAGRVPPLTSPSAICPFHERLHGQVVHAGQHLRHNAPLHLALRRLPLCSNCINFICTARTGMILSRILSHVAKSDNIYLCPPFLIYSQLLRIGNAKAIVPESSYKAIWGTTYEDDAGSQGRCFLE